MALVPAASNNLSTAATDCWMAWVMASRVRIECSASSGFFFTCASHIDPHGVQQVTPGATDHCLAFSDHYLYGGPVTQQCGGIGRAGSSGQVDERIHRPAGHAEGIGRRQHPTENVCRLWRRVQWAVVVCRIAAGKGVVGRHENIGKLRVVAGRSPHAQGGPGVEYFSRRHGHDRGAGEGGAVIAHNRAVVVDHPAGQEKGDRVVRCRSRNSICQ